MSMLLLLVATVLIDCRAEGRGFRTQTTAGGSILFKSRDYPEINMNVSQLITSNGYPCEEHHVTTRDGYILGVQRIPHGKQGRTGTQTAGTRPVVLLQHGLLGSAADWVVNLANQSLAFILSDTGCDVWLANSRGNTYSLRHERLTPDDDKFWDFSWDEMASQDLPATVNYVLSASGANSLVYVGFSQGTQIAFAQLSQDRDLAAKVKLFVALAPIAYLRHMISPLRLLSPFAADIAFMLKVIGYKNFFPSDDIMKQFAAYLAKNEAAAFAIQNIMFLMGGVDYENMNTSRIPVYIAHTPAGTSVKNVMHYAQSVMSGKFTMFDYGKSKNKRKYNQTTPPEYFPANIDVPVALYTGTNDWLSVPRDVKRLKNKLKHLIKHRVVPDWEHLDFTWAMNTPKGCYNDVVKLIKKYNFP